MSRWWRHAAAWLALLACLPALAHKPSDAYLRLQAGSNDGAVEQRLDIAVRDLDRELELDADGDGRITWGELRTRWTEVEALAAAGVHTSVDGQRCRVRASQAPQVDEHSDGSYAVLLQTLDCGHGAGGGAQRLDVSYTLFAASDPTHRGIARLSSAAAVERLQVLGPGTPTATLDLALDAAPAPVGWLGFMREGVHHILIGTDHVLFLLALLLPAVLVRGRQPAVSVAVARLPRMALATSGASAGLGVGSDSGSVSGFGAGAGAGAGALHPDAAARAGWLPAPALRPVLLQVLALVTAFTLAHSVTLALAVLGVLDPPSRWVESLIALSVALAAIDNLRPLLRRRRALFAFGFGLVHGFGFAAVLQDIGLERGNLLAPLLGFNLGVELGQLAIVALFLPLAWALRETIFYRRFVLPGGSLVILALALLWFAERAFNLTLVS